MPAHTFSQNERLSAFSLQLDLQVSDAINRHAKSSLPSEDDFIYWLHTALSIVNKSKSADNTAVIELSIRIVDSTESQTLNLQYRGKDYPTNVLSFSSDLPDYIPSNYIGDLVVCAEVVTKEALEQKKAIHKHWSHMCIHGLLHLFGYDHETDAQADTMEALEREILAALGIDDPYADS